MLKIALADDHKLFRKSLSHLIQTFQDVEVVLEAGDGNELLHKLKETPADMVLLDLQMPGLDGFETCKKLREDYSHIKILILSQLNTKEAVHKIMDLGANGFFSKNSDPDNLQKAIAEVNDKDFYFGQELGSIIREAILWEKNKIKKQKSGKVPISPRELEVIKLACKEYSSIEIADKLCITVRTVDTHRKRIMERTNCKNFIGVVLFALREGLLKLSDL